MSLRATVDNLASSRKVLFRLKSERKSGVTPFLLGSQARARTLERPTHAVGAGGLGRPGAARLRSRKRSGFTLMEMIVATVLLAVGIVGALSVYSTATQTARVGDQLNTAALLAQQKMSDFEENPNFQSGGQSGDFGDQYPGFSYQLNIQATQYQYLYQVSVTVSWGEGPSARERAFTTYLYDTQTAQQDQQNNSSGQSGASGTGSSGG